MQPTWQTTCCSAAEAMSCLTSSSVSAGLLSAAAFEGCFHFLGAPLPVSDQSKRKKGVRACKVSASLNGIPNCDFASCTSSAPVHANTSAIFKCSLWAGVRKQCCTGCTNRTLHTQSPRPTDSKPMVLVMNDTAKAAVPAQFGGSMVSKFLQLVYRLSPLVFSA